MRLTAKMVTIDCADPRQLSGWWAQALAEGEAEHYGDFSIVPAGAVTLGFQRVPEEKRVKNRVHVDFMVADRPAEVARLTGLGAATLSEGSSPDGMTWTVLQDPVGNEFCISDSDH